MGRACVLEDFHCKVVDIRDSPVPQNVGCIATDKVLSELHFSFCKMGKILKNNSDNMHLTHAQLSIYVSFCIPYSKGKTQFNESISGYSHKCVPHWRKGKTV